MEATWKGKSCTAMMGWIENSFKIQLCVVKKMKPTTVIKIWITQAKVNMVKNKHTFYNLSIGVGITSLGHEMIVCAVCLSIILWICDMARLLRGTFVSWWYLPRIWPSVTDMQHYNHAMYPTDDWHLAYMFLLVYFFPSAWLVLNTVRPDESKHTLLYLLHYS